MAMLGTVLVLLGVGAVLGVVVYRRGKARRPAEEPFYVFRCPRCSQKLRYRASKAGLPGMCPRCLRSCKFPATPQAAADDDRSDDAVRPYVGRPLRPGRGPLHVRPS